MDPLCQRPEMAEEKERLLLMAVISRLSLMARLLLYIRHPSHLNGGRPPPAT